MSKSLVALMLSCTLLSYGGLPIGIESISVVYAEEDETPVSDSDDTPYNESDDTPNKAERLVNPIVSKDITEFLFKIIDILLVFAIPIIVLFIMYAGYLFVTARGDEGQISTAKSALTWAVIGGVIVLGAKLIFEIIKGTVAAL